jgi:hypothetical protein
MYLFIIAPLKIGGWWLVAGGCGLGEKRLSSTSHQPPATSHHFSLFQGCSEK